MVGGFCLSLLEVSDGNNINIPVWRFPIFNQTLDLQPVFVIKYIIKGYFSTRCSDTCIPGWGMQVSRS